MAAGEEGVPPGEDPPGGKPPARADRPPAGAPPPRDFEDEPPGAVLFELRPGPKVLAWAILNALALSALGGVALLTSPQTLGQGRLPLALLWLFLPVSAILGLLVTVFLLLNLPAGVRPGPAGRWALGLHLASFAAWALLQWGIGARI